MNEERRTIEASQGLSAAADNEAEQALGTEAMSPTASASLVPRSSLVIPHVACFTPLSPVSSGISYYSEDLLPVLARALDIAVFVDGYEPAQAAALRTAGVRIRDRREFERAAREEDFAATIYQMGNSPAHAYMYHRLLPGPTRQSAVGSRQSAVSPARGIVVLHDVVLPHLRLWMAVNGGRGERRAYADELARLYGPTG